MPRVALKNMQDLEDYVRGCTLLGTGGGGDPRIGMKLLSKTLRQRGEVTWVSPADVPAEAWTVCPLAFCDNAGSVTLVKAAPSYQMVERIGKFISNASFGTVGSAGFLLKGSEMKKALQPGTLTRALQLGRAIREAQESGEDPVNAAAAFLNGWVLFKGVVTEKAWEDRDGYMYGHYCLDGLGKFAGQSFKVWFKNENHMSWLNGKTYVMSPDIIAAVDLKDAAPVTNTDIVEGQELAVLGASIGRHYRTPDGLAVMGPSHYGFNCPYVPIEKLMENS